MARPKNSTKHLSEREAQIMSLFWNNGPMFVRDALEHFPAPKPHFNTVSTIIRGLEDKGYVGHEVINGTFRYYAIAAASDFAKRSLGQIVANYFNNSYTKIVSELIQEEKITVDELQEIIDMVKQQKTKK